MVDDWNDLCKNFHRSVLRVLDQYCHNRVRAVLVSKFRVGAGVSWYLPKHVVYEHKHILVVGQGGRQLLGVPEFISR